MFSLLTEVSPSVELAGFELHLTTSVMARGQAWAGVATRILCRVLHEPHPASAAVEVLGRHLLFGTAVAGMRWRRAVAGRQRRGPEVVLEALDELDLMCPTKDLPHRLPGVTSIDHIAVPKTAVAARAEHVRADPKLSDHDAHVIDVQFG